MFRQLLFESLGIVAGLPPTTGKGAYLQDAALGVAWTYPGATNLNILNYGGDPTGVAGVSGPLASAIAALPANGGTIFFPAGTYSVDALLRIQKSNVRLLGEGPGATSFRATNGFRGPMLCVGDSTASPIPLTLGPALATGAGGSWLVNQNVLTNSRFDLMDSSTMSALDGLSAFTFEFFVKMNSSGGVNVWDCSGNVDFDTGYTSIRSWQFSAAAATTTLNASVTFQSAGVKTITGSSLTVGTIYHVALCYDGSTLSFYIGGVRQGTVAVASDKLSVPWYSESYLGANSPTSFPGLTTTTDSLKDCYIDSIRISNVAVYTGASFTPPTAKLGGFGSTQLLINFDNISADNMVLTGSLGAGGAPSYMINRQASSGAITGTCLDNIQLDGGGALNALAVFNFAPSTTINRLKGINTHRGLRCDNLFLSALNTVSISLAQAQPNQAKYAYSFVVSGITTLKQCRLDGGPLGFYVADSGIDFDTCSVASNSLSTHCWAIEGDNAYSGVSLTSCVIDAEVAAANLRYGLAAATLSIGQNTIVCTNCEFDTGLTTGRPPIFYQQGGSGVDSLVFVVCKFYAEASTASVIQLPNTTAINIQLIGCTQPKQGTYFPWCNQAGFANEWNINRYSSSAGTPGSATINFPLGRFAIAAGTNSATITNNLVKSTSNVIVVKETLDTTLTDFKVVPGAGSFVVTGNNNATGAVTFSFKV